MGKRTRSESNDYESIAKKFKKLERKLLRARRKHRDRQPRQRSSSSSSDTSSSSSSSSRSSSASPRPHSPRASCSSQQEPYNNEDVPAIEYMDFASAPAPDQPSVSATSPEHRAPDAAAPTRLSGTGAAALTQPKASTSRTTDVRQHSHQAESAVPKPRQDSQPLPPEVPELDDEILKILGDDPSQTKVYGKEIRPDLAVRFQHIATVGLSKESRKELLQRYLPPANSTLIDSPTLNPEIKAAIHEHVFKRDKGIEIRQKQVASAISCIGESLTLLLSEQPKSSNTAVIQLLMDAGKILCDCQNAESLVRRSFILHNLKKGLKEEIKTTKIDKFLFSEELADKLKAAKAINKSGDDLKIAPSVQQPKKAAKPPARNLNWQGPPQIQRPKGTQRTKPLAQKNRRYNSSRQSSRPAPTRNSRH